VCSRSGWAGAGATTGAKTGRNSASGGGSGVGGFLPLAAYQEAPRLALPLSQGMMRASDALGGKTLRVNNSGEGKHKRKLEFEWRSHQRKFASLKKR
jgi:hypothetical protein